MNRLTITRSDGRVGFTGNGTPTENMLSIPHMLYRLAAYEDTGLTPEEVNALRAEQENKPLSLDELRQMDGEPVWDNFLMQWCEVRLDLCNRKGAVRYFDGGFNQLSGKRFYRSKPKEEV